nr:MAG TPA: hypothetical protein [Caudoviricetes sp.]
MFVFKNTFITYINNIGRLSQARLYQKENNTLLYI